MFHKLSDTVGAHSLHGGLHSGGLRDTREDEMAYVAGWTISGLATLGTILAVWIFAV